MSVDFSKKKKIDFANKKYMVIDDFSEFRRSVKKMLQSFGAVDIDDFGDGDKAVNQFAMKTYDIVLCDYNLGEEKRDGQQILEEVKHRGLVKQSAVYIMVTAENTMRMVMGALEYKPDAYLTKPFNKDTLKITLEKLITKKEQLEKIEKSIQKKEYAKAIQQIDESVEKNPQNFMELMKLKAETSITIGSYKEAREVYDAILSKDNNVAWALLGLGKIYYHEKDYMEAKDIFEEIIDNNKMFVEAYDWLALALEKLSDLDRAQKILMSAIQISSKAILRQKALGEIALKNGDLEVAEKAFNKAIELGKTSYFKNPDDYSSLAKVMIENKTMEKALEVLRDARSEFREDNKAIMQTAVMEGTVYKELNMEDKAKASIDEALNLYDGMLDSITPDLSLDLAKACMAVGDKEKSKELIKNVVKNNFDDNELLKKSQQIFDEAGLEKEGEALIAMTKKETVQLNNRGVQLVKAGKYSDAIEFFKKAVRGMPGSKVVNANAAQVMLLYMQKNGKDQRMLYSVKKYLDQLASIAPNYKKYHQLLKMYEAFMAGH